MLKNYFRATFRHITKSKGFAFINVIGLAIGIACCLLILIYIFREMSFDNYHQKGDRIYRVVQTYESDSRIDAGASTPFLTGPRLVDEFPQLIENTVRLFNLQTEKLSLANRESDKLFKESNFFFADSTIFDLFSFKLIKGNPEKALLNPQSLVLTEEMATKYFGEVDPIGKQLYFEGRMNLTVTGVMESLPSNSHFKSDFLASFNTLDNFYKSSYDHSWYWNPCWTYILLKEDVDKAELEAQLPVFADKYYHPNLPEGEQVTINLQSLTDIHLYSNLDQEIQANSDIIYIYIFSGVAVLIMIVASVNFINLSTVQSAARSKEVGMRKALGADRTSLVIQFLTESYTLTFIGVMVSVLLVFVMLPFFNELLNINLSFDIFSDPRILASMVAMLLFIGLLSGLYPAMVLSGFKPVKTLRGEITGGKNGQLFRKTLVVLQFGISIILIIGTILVYRQVNFLQDKQLGYDNRQVILIPTDLTGTIWEYENFKNELIQNSNILSVTGVRNVLGSLKNIYSKYIPEGHTEPQSFPTIMVMHDFIKTYSIDLIAGRSFSKDYSTDRTQSVLVNREMVEQFDWGDPDDAIGKSFKTDGKTHTVIGVTENFNHTSLRRQLEPLIMDMPDTDFGIVSSIEYIAVKINTENRSETINFIESTWNKFDKSHPFEYFFHDERLDKIYQSEKKMGAVTASFSILCIIVACLGLFGLASFSAESRKKEIGIRKAMGASVSKIIGLLTREFLNLVILANLIAWPLAYFLGKKWLESFPYKIPLGIESWEIFLGAGFIAIIISLITIGYMSVKTALLNPAKIIREE